MFVCRINKNYTDLSPNTRLIWSSAHFCLLSSTILTYQEHLAVLLVQNFYQHFLWLSPLVSTGGLLQDQIMTEE